jgi:hypothetical protein
MKKGGYIASKKNSIYNSVWTFSKNSLSQRKKTKYNKKNKKHISKKTIKNKRRTL